MKTKFIFEKFLYAVYECNILVICGVIALILCLQLGHTRLCCFFGFMHLKLKFRKINVAKIKDGILMGL